MSARRAVLGVACALLAAAQGAARADGARIFEDADAWAKPERAAVSDADLFPNPPYTHDWQSRSFFLNGRLDDGTFFVINLFHWQFSFLQSWGLQVLVTDTTGRLFSYDSGLPPEDAADPPEGFHHRFGNNLFASAGNEQRVKLDLSGFSCDLRFRNLLPAWEPGDGWAWLDTGHTAYIHYAVPSPLAVLGGSMLSFGNLRRVSGMCTWDSSLSVQPLGQANSPEYSLRAFGASDQPPVTGSSSTWWNPSPTRITAACAFPSSSCRKGWFLAFRDTGLRGGPFWLDGDAGAAIPLPLRLQPARIRQRMDPGCARRKRAHVLRDGRVPGDTASDPGISLRVSEKARPLPHGGGAPRVAEVSRGKRVCAFHARTSRVRRYPMRDKLFFLDARTRANSRRVCRIRRWSQRPSNSHS